MDGLIFVFLIGGIIVAIILRRKIRNPDSAFGRWYNERFKPKGKVITTLFFLGTLLLWAVLFFGASDEDRDKSTQALKTFGKAFRAPEKPASGNSPALPDVNKDGTVK